MSENHFMSEEIKRLTNKLNDIAKALECEKEEDNILTMRFKSAAIIAQIEKFNKGIPIVRYDFEIRKPYLLYPDGRREYELKGVGQ